MLTYILVALFPLLVGSFFDTRVAVGISEDMAQTKEFRRKRFRWLLVAALPMFVLIAFRGQHMGADTGVYLKIFNQITDIPWSNIFAVNQKTYQFESGFVVFEKLIASFTQDDRVYQIIYSAIYLLSIVTFANQLEKHNFSFLYFFATIGTYTFMFTGVRQCLAMCICLLSYTFVKKRKLILFLLMVLLAFTFHKSAILFVIVYFIYNRKINWINAVIYVVFGALAYLYIDVLQNWFNSALDYDYGIEETGNGRIFFAIILVITLYSYFTILSNKKLTYESRGLLNIGTITLVLWLLRLVTRVAERPSYYFVFFSAAMLCYALDAPTNSQDRKIYKVAIYSAFMALYVYKFLTSFAVLVPYVSFF